VARDHARIREHIGCGDVEVPNRSGTA
jgi:hypothetical protein